MLAANERALRILGLKKAFPAEALSLMRALVEECDENGFRVALHESPQAYDCVTCRDRKYPASSICRSCRTVWLSPQPLSGSGSASAEEIIVSLAHEMGHVFDPPASDEPTPDTDAWDDRETEREAFAWRWACARLSNSGAWAELMETLTRAQRDRELAYDRCHQANRTRRRGT